MYKIMESFILKWPHLWHHFAWFHLILEGNFVNGRLAFYLNGHPLKSGSISTKFHVEPSVKGELKICINGNALMIKMATTPIDVEKPFKNLLQNQESIETES